MAMVSSVPPEAPLEEAPLVVVVAADEEEPYFPAPPEEPPLAALLEEEDPPPRPPLEPAPPPQPASTTPPIRSTAIDMVDNNTMGHLMRGSAFRKGRGEACKAELTASLCQ